MSLTEPFEENSLTIIIKNNFSNVFIGKKQFRYLRRFQYTASIDQIYPDVHASLLGFNLLDTELPKIDEDTLVLVQKDWGDLPTINNTVFFIGTTVVGLIQRIYIDLDGEFGTHVQIDFPYVYHRENSHKLQQSSMGFVDTLEQNVNKLSKFDFVKIGWTKIGK